jgi:hypothetical protein
MLSIKKRSLLLLAYTANAIPHNNSASGNEFISGAIAVAGDEQLFAIIGNAQV